MLLLEIKYFHFIFISFQFPFFIYVQYCVQFLMKLELLQRNSWDCSKLYESGLWSGEEPSCAATYCPTFHVAHGWVKMEGRQPGDRAMIGCNPGFQISGVSLVICHVRQALNLNIKPLNKIIWIDYCSQCCGDGVEPHHFCEAGAVTRSFALLFLFIRGIYYNFRYIKSEEKRRSDLMLTFIPFKNLTCYILGYRVPVVAGAGAA
jgi:hypothetical protein